MKPGVPVQIVGVAYDAKSSYMQGTRHAPARIREELLSYAYNPYAESLVDVLDARHCSFDSILQPKSYDHIEPMVMQRLASSMRPLFLGGDHSVTYPIIQAMQAFYGEFHILHFDAHGDLYDTLDGDRYSHACPFARVMEAGLAESLTQVGIRTLTPHQQEQADRFAVDMISMKELDRFDPKLIKGPVYISLDMDVFDPGFAPGVSHRESGGISPRRMIQWLQDIGQPVVGADLVEYNPLRDVSDLTAALCYKLVKELLDAMIRNPLSTSNSDRSNA